MTEEIFVGERHQISGLRGVVTTEPQNETPHSLYLYLGGEEGITGHCLLRPLAIPAEIVVKPKDSGSPPPATSDILTSPSAGKCPVEDEISLLWSAEGTSILAIVHDEPLGFIVEGEKLGYSKAISKKSSWGQPWSTTLANEIFDIGA